MTCGGVARAEATEATVLGTKETIDMSRNVERYHPALCGVAPWLRLVRHWRRLLGGHGHMPCGRSGSSLCAHTDVLFRKRKVLECDFVLVFAGNLWIAWVAL